MAASFVSASTTGLVNAAQPLPSTGYPFTVALWVYPTTTGANKAVWSLTDTGTTNNFFELGQTGGNAWRFGSAAGGASAVAASGSVNVTANRWHFILARAITSTNRHISVLEYSGAVSHATSVTARAPTGLDSMSLGFLNTSSPLNYYDGHIAEYWLTNTNVQGDAAQLLDSTLWQLALGGPFSVPHVARSVVEYRSLRKHPHRVGDELSEVYSVAPQNWTNTNGVTTGVHPPLPYWYEKPGQRRTVLTI